MTAHRSNNQRHGLVWLEEFEAEQGKRYHLAIAPQQTLSFALCQGAFLSNPNVPCSLIREKSSC